MSSLTKYETLGESKCEIIPFGIFTSLSHEHFQVYYLYLSKKKMYIFHPQLILEEVYKNILNLRHPLRKHYHLL